MTAMPNVQLEQDYQIAGNSLEPVVPSAGAETLCMAGVMTLGYGNNQQDWIIRSQVLRLINFFN